VKKFRNKKITKQIGAKLRELREIADLSITDVADMTGFSYPTISAIEKGEEVTASYLVEIAKAIGVHPMEALNIPVIIKPRFPLSPQKKERNRVTQKITKLYEETDFFNTPKFVRDVVKYYYDESKIKVSSDSVSIVLKRFIDLGKLTYQKVGRQNQYYKNRK
jgi:transcriptional regulator with XRE-family HTH domain